ncbi:MAG TPA: UbiA family prenyltransferase [Stellaceae bacterium]|nr:UbiA family prenyltransferase [Stellaceae bacterium]
MTEQVVRSKTTSPLCVDLDGTLIHTDLMHENFASMIVTSPWLLFAIPFWWLKGRAHLKKKIADRAVFDPTLLPYDERVLDYLHSEKKDGRTLILTTASTRSQAQDVADHLGLFNIVFATDSRVNLKGSQKASLLNEELGRFSYLGNDESDIAVWKAAETVGIANASKELERRIASDYIVEVQIPRRRGTFRSMINALRPYQWAKNLLVFVPILTANQLYDGTAWLAALVVFVAFSLTASGIYVLNDLTDLAADRRHLRKRRRAFASGKVPILYGFVLVPLLIATGFMIAWEGAVLSPLAAYVVVSLAYTFCVKEFPLADVFCLTFLYLIRLFAGGLITGFHLSLWLLGFSAFLFLGLAFVKRVSELSAAQRESQKMSRRGYLTQDLIVLTIMGIGSSFASCVLLALFVQSPEVAARYRSPTVLWVLVPLILFWQLRLWLSTARGDMLDDPILYAARDWVSWIASATAAAIIILASGTSFG